MTTAAATITKNDQEGQGVGKDEETIGCHHLARYNLACLEANNGSFDRAANHYIISANLGYHDSLNSLRRLYQDGCASKEDYADALRAHQAAVDATKSSGRKRAEEAIKNGAMKWSF